jgi:aryl-alcohol dehydrogenase-like predicted oxidoreductase
MDYVFFGNTGMRVSELAFGTMSFAGEADEATSRSLYGASRDACINLFDCADVYGRGLAEERQGQCIGDDRDELVITSKAGFAMSRGKNALGASRYHLVRACEASLKRLGTDRIDVYFIHRFDERTDLEQSLRALEQLVSQGKILYPALSNFAAWQAHKALGLCERHGLTRPACVQPMYNLAKRQAEVEILPAAQDANMAVMPYSPLGGGLFTGKYGAAQRPESGRLVQNKAYIDRYSDERMYALAGDFQKLAEARDLHPASLAIAWVAHHPAVTAPILGARNLEQLAPCLAAADIELDDALYEEITALSPAPPSATDRNEEGGPNDMWTR